MSLYSTPEEHAANPPTTWKPVKSGRVWQIVDAAGRVIEYSITTKRQALEDIQTGHAARLWAQESRWYAGEAIPGWKSYAQCQAEEERNRSHWAAVAADEAAASEPGEIAEDTTNAHACGWVGECLCRRERAVCRCGHKNVSHGSHDKAGQFVGVGRGPCGVDMDTRNMLSGYMGDRCDCQKFGLPEPRNTSHSHPILADLREHGDVWTAQDALDSITDMDGDSITWECTAEESAWATRVLTRLVALRASVGA